MPKSKRLGRRVNQVERPLSVEDVRPPQFAAGIRYKHRFRFISLSNSISSITRANMLNLLMTTTSTNVAARLISGIKINRVEVWGIATSTSANPTVSIEWLSNNGPSSEYSDTGSAFYVPHLICTPPPQSLASFWSITGSNESEVLFKYSYSNSGAVIDVWVDIVLMDDETPVTFATTNTATLGQLSAGYLDGQGSGRQLIPASYTSLL